MRNSARELEQAASAYEKPATTLLRWFVVRVVDSEVGGCNCARRGAEQNDRSSDGRLRQNAHSNRTVWLLQRSKRQS